MFVETVAACLLLNSAGAFFSCIPSPVRDSPVVPVAAKPKSLDDATRPSLSGALSRLEADKRIKVELLSLDRLQGRFFRVSDDTLLVAVEKEMETYTLRIQKAFPVDSIQSVWVRKDFGGAGAVVGGVVGIALGVVWASHFEQDCEGDGLEGAAECVGEEMGAAAGAALLGVVLGLAVGALTGLVIGSAITHWELIYP